MQSADRKRQSPWWGAIRARKCGSRGGEVINGNRIVFGSCNTRLYNRSPTGDVRWYATRGERDEALDALRASAVEQGLSPAAAMAGIYPIQSRASYLSRQDRHNILDGGMPAGE